MGMLFGSAAWGLLADKYGRRFGFLATAGFTFVFGMASAAAPDFGWLLLARGLCGFGIGGVPVAFSLMMEWLPASKRGTWGMGVSMFWTVGAMFEALMGLVIMSPAALDLGWRWLVAISSLPLGLLLLLWPVLPESPRWLVSNGRLAEAEAVLQKSALANGVVLPPGRLSEHFESVDDGHGGGGGGGGGAQVWLLLRGAVLPLTLRIWFLWFVSAFVSVRAPVSSSCTTPSHRLLPLPADHSRR